MNELAWFFGTCSDQELRASAATLEEQSLWRLETETLKLPSRPLDLFGNGFNDPVGWGKRQVCWPGGLTALSEDVLEPTRRAKAILAPDTKATIPQKAFRNSG